MTLSPSMPIIGAAGARSRRCLESISLCTTINKLCVTVVLTLTTLGHLVQALSSVRSSGTGNISSWIGDLLRDVLN